MLCFEGASAAAAAKTSQPLDLMIIAARLDAGPLLLKDILRDTVAVPQELSRPGKVTIDVC